MNEDDNKIDVTAPQFSSTPDKAFLNKRNKKTEENKGNDRDENGNVREEGQ